MADQQPNISVIDPVGTAFERVKLMLFAPFDLGRWFVIGFCAWLAYLGQGGGPNFNFPGGHGGPSSGQSPADFFEANLHWIVPVIIIIFVVSIALGLVICWLSSRGRFMFLHCVAQNKAEVKVPWAKYRREGNSLFVFRFVVGLISFVFFAVVAGVIILLFVVSSRGGGPPVPGILIAVAIAVVVILPAAIILGLLMKFTGDFVVPIMYLRLCTCREGWRQFWPLLTANKGKFALYVLFYILIGMAMGTIACVAVFLTCCCVALPYIGTVILLPLFVFDRSYSLYYLRQYGDDYDCFTGEVVSEPPPPQPQLTDPDAGPTRDEITQDDWFSGDDKGDDLLPPLIDE